MMHAQPQRGFTLVETLVAITIIAFALVGPFYAVQQALNVSRTARDELIASSLAQEGVEYVRTIRDNNYLRGASGWLIGLDGSSGSADCQAPKACTVDVTVPRVSSIADPSAAHALYIRSDGFYTQLASYLTAPNVVTKFTRTIQLSNVTPTDAIVKVTVSWKTFSWQVTPYTATVSEHLYNWL